MVRVLLVQADDERVALAGRESFGNVQSVGLLGIVDI